MIVMELISVVFVFLYFSIRGLILGGALFFKNIFLRLVLGMVSVRFLIEFVMGLYIFQVKHTFGVLVELIGYVFGIWLMYRYTRIKYGKSTNQTTIEPSIDVEPNIDVDTNTDVQVNHLYDRIKIDWPNEDNENVGSDNKSSVSKRRSETKVSKIGILCAVVISLFIVTIKLAPQLSIFWGYFGIPVLFFVGALIIIIKLGVFVVRKGEVDNRSINWKRTIVLMSCIVVIPFGLSTVFNDAKTRHHDNMLHERLNEVYRKLGYTGKVEHVHTSTSYNTGSVYNLVDYTYIEEVNGEKIKFPLTSKYDLNSYDIFPRNVSDYVFHEGDAIDYIIKQEAMFKQPQFKTYVSTISQTINQDSLPENMVFKGVSGWITENDEGMKYIVSKFEENKTLGKPVNGYYDLDVKELANKHYINIYVSFSVNDGWSYPSKYFDKFVAYVKQKDFDHYWDGTYNFSFNYQLNGKYSGSGGDSVLVTIKNGKAVNFTTRDNKSL